MFSQEQGFNNIISFLKKNIIQDEKVHLQNENAKVQGIISLVQTSE